MRYLKSQLVQQFPRIQALSSDTTSFSVDADPGSKTLPIIGEHAYLVSGVSTLDHPLVAELDDQANLQVRGTFILFQCGPIPVVGRNGFTIEELLAICVDRLSTYQESRYACNDNLNAILHMTQAMQALDGRTKGRVAKGIEGTMHVDSPVKCMYRIEHPDGIRFRTMDEMGDTYWTDDPAKALTFGLSEHAHAFAAEDPEDVRIKPC